MILGSLAAVSGAVWPRSGFRKKAIKWGLLEQGRDIMPEDIEVMAEDPYFGGKGPHKAGCHLCCRCITGCPYGSKNTLEWQKAFFFVPVGIENKNR